MEIINSVLSIYAQFITSECFGRNRDNTIANPYLKSVMSGYVFAWRMPSPDIL